MTKYKFPSLRLSSDSVVSSETMRRSSSGVEGKSQTAFSTMKSVELAIVMFRSNHGKDPPEDARFQTRSDETERKKKNDSFFFSSCQRKTTKGKKKKEEREVLLDSTIPPLSYIIIFLFFLNDAIRSVISMNYTRCPPHRTYIIISTSTNYN